MFYQNTELIVTSEYRPLDVNLEKMIAKYQMQLRLRDLASSANPPKYPSIHINEDTLSTSMHRFSSYLKIKFVNSYPNTYNLEGCSVCLNLN